MRTNLRKHSLLLTVAAILMIGILGGVYAFSTLTATTGTITITTHTPYSNIVIMGGGLNWNGGNEQCPNGNQQQELDCPPSGPTLYVGDTFQLMVGFGNQGNAAGTLNGITFQGSSTNPSDGMFTLMNWEPQTCSDSGCVQQHYPITIPAGAGQNGNPPVMLQWTIQIVGAGSGTDSASFTFNTSG
jgi:hypothetical protein